MGDTTLRKALDDYNTVYMPYRNFAERTRVEYQNDIKGLIEFLERQRINFTKALSFPIIERYIAHLEQEGFASLTRKRKVVAIRSFLSFLHQDGYIDTNLAKRIIPPFAENTAPHILTETECNRLRLACSANLRDRAIVELLLQTGITLSELVHLRPDDAQIGETGQGFIRVLGHRGKKERVIPLNAKAFRAVNEYVSKRKMEGNNVLFLNRFDGPLGERGVQKMLRRYIKSAGIEGASIRTLRHTFGAHNAVEGTGIKIIQGMMGYKDARSAMVYTSLFKSQNTLS